ncbi:MAG: ubiquitin-like small modifier protein 1 [Dehalococcoidia bacterium]
MTTVRLYASLRELAGDRTVEVLLPDGATVRDVLIRLVELRPGLAGHVLDGEGQVPQYVGVFVDGRDIRYLQGLDTPVRPENEVYIFPPTAGG